MSLKKLKNIPTTNEIKELIKEYTTINCDDDDNMLNIKQTLNKLDRAELIIFILYSELQSERKTAELLGVSRTPIHSILTKIKNKIIESIE